MLTIPLPFDGSDSSWETLHWGFRPSTSSIVCCPSCRRWRMQTRLSIIFGMPDRLDEAKTALRDMGCRTIKTKHPAECIAEEICRFEEEKGIDLVVMGSHGRTGLSKFQMGSVNIAVLEHCTCPVIYRQAEGHASKSSKPSLSHTIL